jgi:hypothetical protein
MSKNLIPRDRRVSNRLHPFVYRTVIGLGLWLILSVWGFHGAGAHTGFVLTVVSIFIGVAVGLPVVLWRISRRHRDARGDRTIFADWAGGDVDTYAGRVKGLDAAITLLLPIAAVSLGMTVFAIVLRVVAKGAA